MKAALVRGYTLIELLIAISILALLASFAVPTYQLILSQLQLTTAANQIADLMRLQEQRTVTEQRTYGLTLTANATTVPYFLCTNIDCSIKTTLSYSLPSNIKISSSTFPNFDVLFTTAGSPDFSGTLILIDTTRGRHRNVMIKPSGAVEDNSAEY